MNAIRIIVNVLRNCLALLLNELLFSCNPKSPLALTDARLISADSPIVSQNRDSVET